MSDKYEATGNVLVIGDTQEFNSGFKKRQLVITTEADSKYPQDVAFEVMKDDCSKLDDLSIGQEVTVHFNLRGNEYQGKYYVNLQCWRLEKGQSSQERPTPSNPTYEPADALAGEDIPF